MIKLALLAFPSLSLAKSGDSFECNSSDGNISLSGVLNDAEMSLELLDKEGRITLEKKDSEGFEFTQNDQPIEFTSGQTLSAYTDSYTVSLNFAKRVFSQNIRSNFSAKIKLYLEGFSLAHEDDLDCKKID